MSVQLTAKELTAANHGASTLEKAVLTDKAEGQELSQVLRQLLKYGQLSSYKH